jgi:tRNA(Ile)-lysidine synthase
VYHLLSAKNTGKPDVNLVDKIKAEIESRTLFPPNSRVVAGVSGGADSVALLHILHRLEYDITAAHLNHSIRGAEADTDEQFVKNLCAKLHVECITQKTDVPALAVEKGVSLEMAAREARHSFFRSLTSDLRSPTSVICLAHHADDQLETFFLRAARGTGLDGLGGMRFSRTLDGLTVIRPMLGIRRAEIIHWLQENKLEWREDVSNADQTIPRNLIRHRILPLLSTLNERAEENILRTMILLRDEADDPERAARRRQIRDWLIKQGVPPGFDTVESVIEFAEHTDGSRTLDLKGRRIVNEYGTLKPDGSSAPRFTIQIKEGTGVLRGSMMASVSLAKVADRAVVVRTVRPGDRMTPYGMTGSKKLQDIFTDLKIPKSQRADWPVVECGGEIIWLPGYRIASGWELASAVDPALHLRADG